MEYYLNDGSYAGTGGRVVVMILSADSAGISRIGHMARRWHVFE